MITEEATDGRRPVDRKLRAVMACAAVLLGGLLVFGAWFVVEQFTDEGSATDNVAPQAGWLVYSDQSLGYSIDYPADGRVDVVDGVATITNRDVACPACEPTPLRMFALTLSPGTAELGSAGTAVTVGEKGYSGTMVVEGDNHLVAKVTYQADGQPWLIVATFTEAVDDTNPAATQFNQMIRSIRHEAS